ncbi:MAG TPA: hypothetical protein VFT37_03160 [Telluria sp.]|nr:hypothetical protein [Telluria sp.]
MKKWRKHNALAAVIVGALVVFGVLATKRTAVEPPPPATAPATAVSAVDQRAIAALFALPELKAWSAAIERNSGGRARGAVIGGDADPITVEGKTYHAYSFMENDPEQARRLQGFYVTQDGSAILVEDAGSGETMTLDEWRQRENPIDRFK